MSAVEQRRAKYMNKKTNENKQLRDNEAMNKLNQFRGKICQMEPSQPQQQSQMNHHDTSLAGRMARRVQQQHQDDDDEVQKQKEKEEELNHHYYHGQNLQEGNDNNITNDWYKTRFQCKKHINSSTSLSSTNINGSDGRHIDEYEVIDERKKSKQKRQEEEKSRNHPHQSHSCK
jgi:hypothetical protein